MQGEQGTQLGVRGLLDGADLGPAGVVDEHVDPAVLLHRRVDGRLRRRAVGDVERDGVDQGGVGRDELVEGLGPADGGDHRVARLHGGLRDRPAEAAARAGHEPHPGVGHEGEPTRIRGVRLSSDDVRIGMMLSYSGGFAETVAELAEHEQAGLDVVWVPEAYSFDAVSQLGFLAARTSFF